MRGCFIGSVHLYLEYFGNYALHGIEWQDALLTNLPRRACSFLEILTASRTCDRYVGAHGDGNDELAAEATEANQVAILVAGPKANKAGSMAQPFKSGIECPLT